uniref:Uncharacterized protein n=1 Tax=Oryza brachyantha TaxID=4533 RepID=J3LEV1_ORYBR
GGRTEGVLPEHPPGDPRRSHGARAHVGVALLPLQVVRRHRQERRVQRRRRRLLGARPGPRPRAAHAGRHVRPERPHQGAAQVQRGVHGARHDGGRVLPRGPVPEFCGESENTTEARSVMAWGHGVAVPGFARESLAEELRRGDAEVDVALTAPADVALTAPARYCAGCWQTVYECKPHMGSSSAEFSPRCAVTSQIPTFPDHPEERYPGWPGTIVPGRRYLR